MSAYKILEGDCLHLMQSMEENSIDSLVTDPPAGISFMGKSWDSDHGGREHWVGRMRFTFEECLRVMKPGAHGLVWAIPRTSHWTATALEDAGFEIRDVVTHLFGSGFPKSLDVSKQIDKQAGAVREVLATLPAGSGPLKRGHVKATGGGMSIGTDRSPELSITAPATDVAKQWQGFGTALKPASEHWILVRKPCSEKTVAANVLKWGCGAINIDASRVGSGENRSSGGRRKADQAGTETLALAMDQDSRPTGGRFPGNLILSHTDYCTDGQCDIECAIAVMDGQSGVTKSVSANRGIGYHGTTKKISGVRGVNDSGGASRFFYCAKAPKSDKNAGLEGMPLKTYRTGCGGKMPIDDDGKERDRFQAQAQAQAQNVHPTVKSTKLMSYLITLVTPPGGVVLDPFMGSGSTGVAAIQNGFKFVGIEKEAEYAAIAKMRLIAAEVQ